MNLKYLKKNNYRSFNKRLKNLYNYLSFQKFLLNLIVKKQIIFEFTYFKIIKLLLKKTFKYKYQIFNFFSFFFNLLPNYPISLKHKNSRMGKGIGKFSRWTFLLKSNTILLSFTSQNINRIFFLLIFLKKRIYQNIQLIVNNDNY